MHGRTCKQHIFQSCDFQSYAFWWKPFHMPVRKRRQKCLRVSNVPIVLVVFKWHRISDGVNFTKQRIPDRKSSIGKRAVPKCFGLNMSNACSSSIRGRGLEVSLEPNIKKFNMVIHTLYIFLLHIIMKVCVHIYMLEERGPRFFFFFLNLDNLDESWIILECTPLKGRPRRYG